MDGVNGVRVGRETGMDAALEEVVRGRLGYDGRGKRIGEGNMAGTKV